MTLIFENHQNHNQKWVLENTCVACLIEILQHLEKSSLKKNLVVKELNKLVITKKEQVLAIFENEEKILTTLMIFFIDLISLKNQIIKENLIKCCLAFIDLFILNHHLLLSFFDSLALKLKKALSRQKDITDWECLLDVMSTLLQKHSRLLSYLHPTHGDLFHSMLQLMVPEQDEKTLMTITCSFVHLLMANNKSTTMSSYNALSVSLLRKVCLSSLSLLSTSELSEDLTINLLGLLKLYIEWSKNINNEKIGENERINEDSIMLNNETTENNVLLDCLLRLLDTEMSILLLLKKLLFRGIIKINIASITCLLSLLDTSLSMAYSNAKPSLQGSVFDQFCSHIFQADLTDFLFEALNHTDAMLIQCVVSCLTLLTRHPDFFSKCHDVYGMSSVLRCVDISRSIDTELYNGVVSLLCVLLKKHSEHSVKLINNRHCFLNCLNIVSEILKHFVCLNRKGMQEKEIFDHASFSLACELFKLLLRIDHLVEPLPLKEITSVLEEFLKLLDNTHNFSEQSCIVSDINLHAWKLVSIAKEHNLMDDSAFSCADNTDNLLQSSQRASDKNKKTYGLDKYLEFLVNVLIENVVPFFFKRDSLKTYKSTSHNYKNAIHNVLSSISCFYLLSQKNHNNVDKADDNNINKNELNNADETMNNDDDWAVISATFSFSQSLNNLRAVSFLCKLKSLLSYFGDNTFNERGTKPLCDNVISNILIDYTQVGCYIVNMKKDEKNVTNVSIDGDYVEEVVDDDKDDAGCLVEDDHNESQDHYKKTFFYTNNNNALKQNKKNSIKTSYSNSNNNDNNNNNNSNNKINTRDVLVNDKEAYIHLIISGVNSQEGDLEDILQDFLDQSCFKRQNADNYNASVSDEEMYARGVVLLIQLSIGSQNHSQLASSSKKEFMHSFILNPSIHEANHTTLTSFSLYLLTCYMKIIDNISLQNSKAPTKEVQCNLHDWLRVSQRWVHVWCDDHGPFLQWCLHHDLLSDYLIEILLPSMLLKSCHNDHICKLMTIYHKCTQYLITLLINYSNTQVLSNIMNILKSHVLKKQSTSTPLSSQSSTPLSPSISPIDPLNTHDQSVFNMVITAAPKLFICFAGSVDSENLSSFIQLLSFLYTNKLSSDKGAKYNYDDGVNKMNSIEVRELKIASCVQALLKTQEFYRMNDKQIRLYNSCLQYLSSVLLYSLDIGDYRIFNLLATSNDFIDFINHSNSSLSNNFTHQSSVNHAHANLYRLSLMSLMIFNLLATFQFSSKKSLPFKLYVDMSNIDLTKTKRTFHLRSSNTQAIKLLTWAHYFKQFKRMKTNPSETTTPNGVSSLPQMQDETSSQDGITITSLNNTSHDNASNQNLITNGDSILSNGGSFITISNSATLNLCIHFKLIKTVYLLTVNLMASESETVRLCAVKCLEAIYQVLVTSTDKDSLGKPCTDKWLCNLLQHIVRRTNSIVPKSYLSLFALLMENEAELLYSSIKQFVMRFIDGKLDHTEELIAFVKMVYERNFLKGEKKLRDSMKIKLQEIEESAVRQSYHNLLQDDVFVFSKLYFELESWY